MNGRMAVVDLETVRQKWGWILVLGIVLVILGTIALGMACTVTIASMLMFGILLLVGAVAEFVEAFTAGAWGGFFLHLLMGALNVVLGLFLIFRPVEAAVNLTLIIAMFLFVGGIFRIGAAVAMRFPNWGWAVLSGLVSAVLGVAIISRWPYDALWFIGMCIGVDLIFQGWGWVMLALSAKSLPARPQVAPAV